MKPSPAWSGRGSPAADLARPSFAAKSCTRRAALSVTRDNSAEALTRLGQLSLVHAAERIIPTRASEQSVSYSSPRRPRGPAAAPSRRCSWSTAPAPARVIGAVADVACGPPLPAGRSTASGAGGRRAPARSPWPTSACTPAPCSTSAGIEETSDDPARSQTTALDSSATPLAHADPSRAMVSSSSPHDYLVLGGPKWGPIALTITTGNLCAGRPPFRGPAAPAALRTAVAQPGSSWWCKPAHNSPSQIIV